MLKLKADNSISKRISSLLNNHKEIFLFLVFVGISVIISIVMWQFITTLSFRNDYFVCFEVIEDQGLYQNDPFCYQGPVGLYIGYWLHFIAGKNFFIWLTAINILIGYLAYVLIRNIILFKTKRNYSLLSLILTVLIYYPLSLDFPTGLASILFLSGFYLLLTKHEWKYAILSGILFSLSFLSKISTLTLIALCTLLFLIKFGKEKIKNLLLIYFGFLLTSLGFWIIFHKIYHYLFLSVFAIAPDIGIIKAIFDIFNFTKDPYIFIQSISIIIFSIYSFLKTKDESPVLFSLFLLFICSYYRYTQVKLLVFGAYYAAPFVIFFIISFILLIDFYRSKKKREYLLWLILFSFVISSTPILENHKIIIPQYDVFAEKVSTPYLYGDFNATKILVASNEIEFNRIYSWSGKNITFDYMYAREDGYAFKRLKKIKILGETGPIKYILDKKYYLVKENIKTIDYNLNNSYYELLFLSSDAIYNLLSYTTASYSERRLNLSSYCKLTLPNLDKDCDECYKSIEMLFRDKSACESFKKKAFDYYSSNFDYFCSVDQEYSEKIGTYLSIMNSSWRKYCAKGGNFLYMYYHFETNLVIFVFILLFLIASYQSYNYYFQQKKTTIGTILLIFVIVYSFLGIYLIYNNSSIQKSSSEPIIVEANYSNAYKVFPLDLSQFDSTSKQNIYFLLDKNEEQNVTDTIQNINNIIGTIIFVDFTGQSFNIHYLDGEGIVKPPLLYCGKKLNSLSINGPVDDYGLSQIISFIKKCNE